MGRGYCYEIVTDKDYVLSMSEGDLYEYAQHEFDYANDLGDGESVELARDFANRISESVKELTNEDGTFFAVEITKEDKLRYFGDRLEKAREIANRMTAEEFATTSCYDLQKLVSDDYADMVYLGNGLYTLDSFIRDAIEGKTYYIGNVCFIH